jgi:AcrR family transcriptional regulator
MDTATQAAQPGPQPTDSPQARLKSAVTAATLAVCREKGYAGLRLDDVAERAGTTTDVLTATWPSKAALVISAFRGLIARDLVYADTGDFAADLRGQLVGMVRVLTEPSFGPFLAELIAEAQQDETTAGAFLDYVFRPNRAAARERFAAAQRAGQLRTDVDLDVAIDLTFAPVWFRFLLRTGPLTAEYATQVADQALAGLRPPA